MCNHTCPTWLCSLGVTQDPLCCVPWALCPSFLKEENTMRKYNRASCHLSRQGISLICFAGGGGTGCELSPEPPGTRARAHKSRLSYWASPRNCGVSMISLHCQGAAQPPNSHPSGRDIHNFHLNPDVSFYLASLLYRTTWSESP